MKFRVLHLSDTPWFRTVEADTAWLAAERILQREMRNVAVHHHTFEGDRATTFIIPGTWITVIHPSAP